MGRSVVVTTIKIFSTHLSVRLSMCSVCEEDDGGNRARATRDGGVEANADADLALFAVLGRVLNPKKFYLSPTVKIFSQVSGGLG